MPLLFATRLNRVWIACHVCCQRICKATGVVRCIPSCPLHDNHFFEGERAPLPPNILHQISPERSSLFSHAPRPFVDLLSVATPTRLQCSRDSSLHSLHFHQRMPSSQNRQPSIGGSQEDTGDLWCKWKTAKNCSHGLWKCGCVLVRKAVANDLGG